MAAQPEGRQTGVVITCDGLQVLIDALAARGYAVLGPTVRDGAIVYDRIDVLSDLPAGWTDRQDAGQYRLERRDDGALFGYVVGPHSWKRFLHPPVETLCTARGRVAPLRLPRHARLRAARRGHPGPRVPRRPVPQRTLRSPSRRRLLRRRQLRPGGRHVLLRVDADGAQGGFGL